MKKWKGCGNLYSRGNGLLKEEKSLDEIHKIRENISKMDKKEKREHLKKIRKNNNERFKT